MLLRTDFFNHSFTCHLLPSDHSFVKPGARHIAFDKDDHSLHWEYDELDVDSVDTSVERIQVEEIRIRHELQYDQSEIQLIFDI